MSEDAVIDDVGETLITLLRDNMSDLVEKPEAIALASPGDAGLRLSLFLYRVSENVHLKNQGMLEIDPNRFRSPPLFLDLNYLMTTYKSDAETEGASPFQEAHRTLGRAMRIFHDHSILTGSVLLGTLKGSDEEIKIRLDPISLDDMNRLWSIFPEKDYQISVSYTVSPVAIDSSREIETRRVASRVREYGAIEPGRKGR